MDTKKFNWQFLNATTLKLIAAALMFIDHIHEMFSHVGAPMWLTMLGRLVFPMFLFASSESFHYTHSKKRYLIRLLIASWFMSTFTFILQGILPNDNVVLMNNAFSTFFVTGLYMLFWDIFADGVHKKSIPKIIGAILLCFIPVLLTLPMLTLRYSLCICLISLLLRVATSLYFWGFYSIYSEKAGYFRYLYWLQCPHIFLLSVTGFKAS